MQYNCENVKAYPSQDLYDQLINVSYATFSTVKTI